MIKRFSPCSGGDLAGNQTRFYWHAQLERRIKNTKENKQKKTRNFVKNHDLVRINTIATSALSYFL